MPNLSVIPSIGPGAELRLKALRDELGVLHEINGILKNAPIRAHEWPKAEQLLGYLGAKIDAIQADADALTPPEPLGEPPAPGAEATPPTEPGPQAVS